MRVTREQAMAYAEWTQPLNTPTCRNLATSYLAALDVCEAAIRARDVDHDDAALDAALEKWREG